MYGSLGRLWRLRLGCRLGLTLGLAAKSQVEGALERGVFEGASFGTARVLEACRVDSAASLAVAPCLFVSLIISMHTLGGICITPCVRGGGRAWRVAPLCFRVVMSWFRLVACGFCAAWCAQSLRRRSIGHERWFLCVARLEVSSFFTGFYSSSGEATSLARGRKGEGAQWSAFGIGRASAHARGCARYLLGGRRAWRSAARVGGLVEAPTEGNV